MNGSRGIGKTTLHLKLRYAGIITVVRWRATIIFIFGNKTAMKFRLDTVNVWGWWIQIN